MNCIHKLPLHELLEEEGRVCNHLHHFKLLSPQFIGFELVKISTLKLSLSLELTFQLLLFLSFLDLEFFLFIFSHLEIEIILLD